jgi:hypothetical protein
VISGNRSATACSALEWDNGICHDVQAGGPFVTIVCNQPQLDTPRPLHGRKFERDRPSAFGMPLFTTECQKHDALDSTGRVCLHREPEDQPFCQRVP